MSKKNTCEKNIYLSDNEQCVRLFKFIQNKNEGSIYVWIKNVEKAKWIITNFESEPYKITILDGPIDEKISLHRSGLAKIETYLAPRVSGIPLIDFLKSTIWARHLFSIIISEPDFFNSENLSSKTNDEIISIPTFQPMSFVFFAIPKLNKEISITGKIIFKKEELIDFNYGFFDLHFHGIFWFAYRTKLMERWLKFPHICCSNGNIIPLFMGGEADNINMEFRNGLFNFQENNLSIVC